MEQAYIITDKTLQEEILSKEIKVKSWGELAVAVREKAKRLASVADAFERYEQEGQPLPGGD